MQTKIGYSQASQDVFVQKILEDSPTKFFVDVGAGYDFSKDQEINSNSLLLENSGWEGIAIDLDMHRMQERKCACCAVKLGDGSEDTKLLSQVLRENCCPKLVDYLSIDLDGLDYQTVRQFIEGGYEFKILTIEHDLYSGKNQAMKGDIFLFLSAHGYVRFANNVGLSGTLENLHTGYPYEDWYINPKYLNYSEVLRKMKS